MSSRICHKQQKGQLPILCQLLVVHCFEGKCEQTFIINKPHTNAEINHFQKLFLVSRTIAPFQLLLLLLLRISVLAIVRYNLNIMQTNSVCQCVDSSTTYALCFNFLRIFYYKETKIYQRSFANLLIRSKFYLFQHSYV